MFPHRIVRHRVNWIIHSHRAFATFTSVYVDNIGVDESHRLTRVRLDDARNIYRLREKVGALTMVDFTRLTVFESRTAIDAALTDSTETPVRDDDNPLYVYVEPTAEEKAPAEKRKAAIVCCERFVSAILKAQHESFPVHYEDGDDSEGSKVIYVYNDIPYLMQENKVGNLVIRESVDKLWDCILETVCSRPLKRPVAAVGNAGIGKSYSIYLGIKKILELGNSVTFIERSESKLGFFYQFVPQQDGTVQCNVYPETTPLNRIPTMEDPEAFLIVDPGQTKSSCNWVQHIKAKLIIVPSPDSNHWGRNEFRKQRMYKNEGGGSFLYFPAFTAAEIYAVIPHLKVTGLDKKRVDDRFYWVGGNLRDLSSTEADFNSFKTQVETEVSSMTPHLVSTIARGVFSVDSSRQEPSSKIVGISTSPPSFLSCVSMIQSRHAAQCIANKAGGDLWFAAQSNRRDGDTYMEQFMSLQLSTHSRNYDVRKCVGKEDRAYKSIVQRKLGGAGKVKVVHDIAASILDETGETKTSLYMSSDPHHNLFDMMYRDEKVYYAINVTKSKQKKLPKTFKDLLQKLVKKLQLKSEGRRLEFYYATSFDDFGQFVTEPVEPDIAGIEGVELFHLHITEQPKDK